MRRASSKVACAAAAACALAGCQFARVADDGWPWPQAEPVEAARAAPYKPAPKTLPAEIVFARTDGHDTGWQDELWNLADEQAFDHALRRRLAANGLRAGIVTGPLPPALAARLEPQAATSAAGELPNAAADRPAVTRRFLKLLPGRDNEIVAAAGVDELILLEHDGGEVQGGTYRDATTFFSLKAWPAADGRLQIELVPTVKHGPLERAWVGEEGAFRLETGQKRQPLERLAIAVAIPQGGMLVVGPAGDASSTVGDAFFGADSTRRGRRLLVIRPDGPPTDPLFAEPVRDEPIFDETVLSEPGDDRPPVPAGMAN
jgi:hypothetical protein